MPAFRYTFEWDPAKAAAGRGKHGVGFEQAAAVFNDAPTLTIYDEDHSETDEHWVMLDQAANGQLLVVAHTYQELNEQEAVIRIISARRATTHVQHQYEQGA